MSVNQKLISALSGLGYPVLPDVYDGDKKTYIVFNYSTIPDCFGDDEPTVERYLIQVHLFGPVDLNTVGIRKQIKRCLFVGDFTWPSEGNASDKTGQHFVFECETVEGVDVNGQT